MIGRLGIVPKEKTERFLTPVFMLVFISCVIWIYVITSFELASATTYYVKPIGNDSDNGTSEETAWQHVQMACSTLVAGDTVLIRTGIYDEINGNTCPPGVGIDCGLHFESDGNVMDGPIVAKGYPGDVLPIIKGDSTNRYAANLENSEYIILDSLKFTHGYRGITFGIANHITIRNCVVCSTGFDLTDPNNNGGVSLLFNGRNCLNNIVVENCEFFDNWDETHSGSNCVGIQVYSCEVCSLRNNLIHDQHHGIYIKGNSVGNDGLDSLVYVHGNVIYDVSSGIGTHGQGTAYGIYVYENIIYGFTEDGMEISVGSADGQATNCVFYNNVIDGGGGNNRGFNARFGSDSTRLYNNIFYNCGDNSGDYRREVAMKGDEEITNFMEDYDCVYDDDNSVYFYHLGSNWTLAQWQANTDDGDNTIAEDPLFVSPATHDYHLQPDSPCKGAGLGGVDMGAYPLPLGVRKSLMWRK